MRLLAPLAVIAALGTTGTARADYVFDTFNVPSPGDFAQIDLYNQGQTYNGPSYSIGSAVGGNVSRTVSATVTTPPPAFPNNLFQASLSVGGGALTLATQDTAKANVTVTYSLTGAASNLTGATALDLDFSAFNAGNSTLTTATTTIPVTVQIVTSSGTRTRTFNVAGDTSFAIGGPWTGWSLTNGTGTNLASVSSIKFILNGGTNSRYATDFTLDEVRVKGPTPVPAPPALALALGALPILALRRRFNRPNPA